MSSIWFLEGIKKGRKTEKFPIVPPKDPPLRPSRLEGKGEIDCPTNAVENDAWDSGKCIFCRRCEESYRPTGNQDIFTVKSTNHLHRKSFYIYKLDSGSCGACNTELSSIFDPQYDANRLNIFQTNTPRHADAIVIMGVLTDGMKEVLQKAYEAMPDPKLIIALGSCAISGGIIGESALPRDQYNVEISGCPPSPYTILKAISMARGD
ncbi:MAG: NADH:ubiquinone oxidoreductase [Candidatus Thermoplasmatota archaeon]|nr:NADH:ubiquinone oxidoreductase [Candidatus Thermoplasmatota archaeon]